MELISKHLHTITTMTNTLKQAHKRMVRTKSNVLHIETNRAFSLIAKTRGVISWCHKNPTESNPPSST